MNLSQHFTLEELIFSQTAARRGFDNTPDEGQIEKLTYLAARLEEVRTLLGPLHVNSGYRCPQLNAAVGSRSTSQHLKCEAADLTSLRGLTPLQMCLLVEASAVPFDQLILEFTSWMHISFVQGSVPRSSVLTIDKRGVLPGLVEAI